MRTVAENGKSIVTDVLPHISGDKDITILDLGCGFGTLVLCLQRLGYRNVSGVDISKEQIDVAIEIGAKNVVVGTLHEALSNTVEKVGVITMIDVIEHLTKNEAIEVLQSCYDKLEEGGTIVMRTPNVDAYFGTVLSFGDLTHEMHLNKLSAQELFASLPYKFVQILPARHSDANLAAKILKTMMSPFTALFHRLQCVAYGMSSSMLLTSANMIIVVRK
ncbi:MAG: class I SAM-dependent methyltransferase [Ignavibacteria bacterium]|nr:class I SAM-dependent methyltransferase [Ignavibacteria bacterium]